MADRREALLVVDGQPGVSVPPGIVAGVTAPSYRLNTVATVEAATCRHPR